MQRFLILLSCVFIASCATVDPRYDSLIGSAETKPKRDVIVGMWQHKDFNAVGTTATRVTSCLFQSNGQAIYRFTVLERPGATPEVIEQYNLTWSYDGGGQWTMHQKPIYGGALHFKLAQGFLLGTRQANRYVFERAD